MSGWTEDNSGYEGLYGIESFSSWDEYIRFLKARASGYSKWFEVFFGQKISLFLDTSLNRLKIRIINLKEMRKAKLM